MTTAHYPSGASTPPSAADDGSSGAKEQAKQAAGTAADESKHVAGVAQDEAQKVASEAKSQVTQLVGQATTQVEDQSRSQLGRLAETLRSFGDDLEKMSAQSDGPASGLASEAAERLHGVSSHLEGREPRELLDDLRSFARRKPGVFLGSALVAGVVAGRLTRGAKAAHDGGPSSATTTVGGGYPVTPATSAYDEPVTADVTSPGQPGSVGYDAPSSGQILDPSTQGHGTATGDPLAGTGTPGTDPVYPGGSELRGDLS